VNPLAVELNSGPVYKTTDLKDREERKGKEKRKRKKERTKGKVKNPIGLGKYL